MAISDAKLLFSDAQAITASDISDNVYNSGPLFTGNTGINWGVGTPLDMLINVDTTFADTGSDSTVTVTVESDSTEDLATSPTVHGTAQVLAALSAAGTVVRIRLNPDDNYEQYIGLRYTVTGGNLSAGAVTAVLVPSAAPVENAGDFASALNFI